MNALSLLRAKLIPRSKIARSLKWLFAAGVCASFFALLGCKRATVPSVPSLPPSDYDPQIVAAIEQEKARVVDHPDSGAAWGRLGSSFMAHNFHKEAIECFAQAERLQLSEPRWPYLSGVLLLSWDANAAIPKLQRAAELANDTSPAPRLRLVDALLERGELDQAEKHLQRLALKYPEEPYVLLALGKLAAAKRQPQDALKYLAKSAVSPQTARASLALIAGLIRQLGDAEGAAKASSQMANLPPDSPMPDPFMAEVGELQTGMQAWLSRAERLFKAGKQAEGLTLLEKAATTYPTSAAPWRMLGQAQMQANDTVKAEESLRRAIALSPGESASYYQLGTVLGSQGRFAEAAESFQKAIALRPDDASAYYHLAQCFMRQNKTAQAIEAYQNAIRYDPSFAAAYSQLGNLLEETGQYDEAVEAWTRAVKLDPQDTSAAQHLEKPRDGREPKSINPNAK